MPYTYRYSREMLVTVTAYCPICRKKLQWFSLNELKNKDGLKPYQLCCSSEHEQDYIKQVIRLNVQAGKEVKRKFPLLVKDNVDAVIDRLIRSHIYNLTQEIEDNIPKFERK